RKLSGRRLRSVGIVGVSTRLGGWNLHWWDQCRDYRWQCAGTSRAALAEFLGRHNGDNQDVAICSRRTAGGMAKSSERADDRDVWPTRLLHTAPTPGLVFTRQLRSANIATGSKSFSTSKDRFMVAPITT